MKTTQKQSGSAHVVIVIILVFVIVGLLGFVFWQQMSGKPKTDNVQTGVEASATNTNTSPAVSNQTASTANTYMDAKNGYSFEYPKDWAISGTNCLASCNDPSTFTVRSPDFTMDNQGNQEGAVVVVSPNGLSGSLSDQRKKDESFTAAKGYTYYFDFTDTTVGNDQAYQYHTTDRDHSKVNDGISIVFMDKKGSLWIFGGTGASVTTSSSYDGVKATELIRSTWKWL